MKFLSRLYDQFVIRTAFNALIRYTDRLTGPGFRVTDDYNQAVTMLDILRKNMDEGLK